MVVSNDNDDDEEGDDLFKWGDEYVRGSDPSESHDASGKVDYGKDRKTIFFILSDLIASDPDHATRKVLEYEYLIAKGYDHVKADSLTRRLSDLVERKNNKLPKVLWLFIHSGKRYDHSAILTYTERGLLVLADPKIMTGLWNLREKKRPDPGDDPPNGA